MSSGLKLQTVRMKECWRRADVDKLLRCLFVEKKQKCAWRKTRLTSSTLATSEAVGRCSNFQALKEESCDAKRGRLYDTRIDQDHTNPGGTVRPIARLALAGPNQNRREQESIQDQLLGAEAGDNPDDRRSDRTTRR